MNFVKISEGHYINLDQIAEIRQDGGNYKLVFANSEFPVVVGKEEFERIEGRINGNNGLF